MNNPKDDKTKMGDNKVNVVYGLYTKATQLENGSIRFHYTTLSGTPMTHIYSADKPGAIYKQIKLDRWYVIVTTKTVDNRGRNRWVYSAAFPCSQVQAHQVHNDCGFTPTTDVLSTAVTKHILRPLTQRTANIVNALSQLNE